MQDTLRHLPEHLLSAENHLESEDLFVLVQKLAAAILIGLLIGMEREHSKPESEKTFAGVRTFPLISILGFSAALISTFTSEWIYVVILLSFGSLVTVSHIFSAKEGQRGGTTEISLLIVFILGSLVLWNYIILAAVIGVIVNLFLTLKFQFHSFVGKISDEDLYATLKLAIITIIIFPLLPDRTYGPFDVINPRMIWLMVIFISGISFAGYIIIKYFGTNKGIALTGLMGGMVSSTAVTISLSKKSKENKSSSNNFAVGIILASTVMYVRIFVVAIVVNYSLIGDIWFPTVILTATGLLISFIISKKVNPESSSNNIEFKNPFELKSALLFGLTFGVVIFLSKAAEVYLGKEAIYAASALAGITSVDAIVVSLGKLIGDNLTPQMAVAAIIISTISNNIVKGIIAFMFGAQEIRKYILLGLGLLTVVSAVYLGFLISL